MLVAPGIAALEITAAILGKETTVHPALLWDEETALLVDTGYPGQSELLRAAAEADGAPWARLTHILLTHHDIDHIGCAADLLAASGGRLSILAHRIEAPYLDGAQRPLKLARLEDNLDGLPAPMKAIYENLKMGYAGRAVDVWRTLEDGEVLPFAGGLEVIFTPGHTLGHICLYHIPSRTLIAGDALVFEDGRMAPSPAYLNHDGEAAIRSLARLAAYAPAAVICYHGGVYRGEAQQMIRALAQAPAGV